MVRKSVQNFVRIWTVFPKIGKKFKVDRSLAIFGLILAVSQILVIRF